MNDSNDKTEFLFESDAEKVILKEASKPKKKKIYKKIIFNTIIISFIVTGMFYVIKEYEDKELASISASVINQSNFLPNNNETLNSAKDLLKPYNNYNKKYEIIVNKANPINEEILANYNIVEVKNNLFGIVKLEEETYKHYLDLKDNLKERGYYINIKTGYKTLAISSANYNTYLKEKGSKFTEKYISKPGESEHNTGLSFDFTISSDKYSTKTNYEGDEYKYLENIAYLYGFIIRYPKDKENLTGFTYEPWHLRYVGTGLAKYLKKNNLCLEEYYEIN